MQRILARKIKILAVICSFTCLAGMIYQLISEEYIGYESILIGLPLGLVFGVIELFLFRKTQQKLRRLPFTWLITVKAILYTAIIFLVTATIGLIVGLSEGKQIDEFYEAVLSRSQVAIIVYTLLVYMLIIFYLQINRLLGEGVLFKFLKGKYYRSTEEERIFMFKKVLSSVTRFEYPIAIRIDHS